MTDAPKHPTEPDPANELASDSSSIDPGIFAMRWALLPRVSPSSRPLRPMESPMG